MNFQIIKHLIIFISPLRFIFNGQSFLFHLSDLILMVRIILIVTSEDQLFNRSGHQIGQVIRSGVRSSDQGSRVAIQEPSPGGENRSRSVSGLEIASRTPKPPLFEVQIVGNPANGPAPKSTFLASRFGRPGGGFSRFGGDFPRFLPDFSGPGARSRVPVLAGQESGKSSRAVGRIFDNLDLEKRWFWRAKSSQKGEKRWKIGENPPENAKNHLQDVKSGFPGKSSLGPGRWPDFRQSGPRKEGFWPRFARFLIRHSEKRFWR